MNTYNLVVKPEDNRAIMKMGKEALGGEDAMAFTNTIKKIPENINMLVLDMTDLELINSTGLGMIAKANNELKLRNIDLILLSVNHSVSRLLEITHLNKIFRIVDNISSI